MVYKQLIDELKKIKNGTQVSSETANTLTDAAIQTYMQLYKEHEGVAPEDALDMARASILKECDFVLLDIHEQYRNMEINDDQIPSLENLPFGDDLLKKQIDKVFKDYNKRIENK